MSTEAITWVNDEAERPEAQPYTFVVVGGGSGVASLLRGVRQVVDQAEAQGDPRAIDAEVVGVVTGVDNGGSTGRLAAMENTLPVGDMRRGLSELTADHRVARRVEHRFGAGDSETVIRAVGRGMLSLLRKNSHVFDEQLAEAMIDGAVAVAGRQQSVEGHSFGNLLLTAEATRQSDLGKASDTLGALIGARGRVLPASDVRHDLVVVDGERTYIGEHVIDDMGEGDFLDPRSIEIGLTTDLNASPDSVTFDTVPVYAETDRVIRKADVLLSGLGSRTTSVVPGLLAVRQPIRESEANVIIVTNLEEQPETAGMSAEQHIAELRGITGRVDAVVVNADVQPLHDAGKKALTYDADAIRLMPRSSEGQLVDATQFIEVHERDLVAIGIRKAARNDQLAATRSSLLTDGFEVGQVAIDMARSRTVGSMIAS